VSPSVREKGFSLGYFDDRYLCEGPVARVMHGGRAVAFANLWTSTTRAELSIDLMRHVREAPRGTMEFLFTALLLWGKGEGYLQFNLGMAPLSGLLDGEVDHHDGVLPVRSLRPDHGWKL